MTVAEIAEQTGGEVDGDGSVQIGGVASLDSAGEGQLSVVAKPAYDPWILKTNASALLLYRDAPAADKPAIRVENPDLAFIKILRLFHPRQASAPPGIHASAVIGEGVELGRNVSIQAHVVIGDRVKIGDGVVLAPCTVIGDNCDIGAGSVLYPTVSLREGTILGKNVIIHDGAVIGSDGFGYVQAGGTHHKIPHIGRVVIEDDVEIGANCTIDRGTLGETRIGSGTKLDNLIHVAHNVVLGRNIVVAAQTGFSGSTEIGDNCMIGGQVGFVDHVTIGSNVAIAAQSGITKDLPSNTVYFGSPARPLAEAKRIEAVHHKLPELKKLVMELKKRIEKLEGK